MSSARSSTPSGSAGVDAIRELSEKFDGVDGDRHPRPARGPRARAGRARPGHPCRARGVGAPAPRDLRRGAGARRRHRPRERARGSPTARCRSSASGLYVPGGLAPLVSSVRHERGARRRSPVSTLDRPDLARRRSDVRRPAAPDDPGRLRAARRRRGVRRRRRPGDRDVRLRRRPLPQGRPGHRPGQHLHGHGQAPAQGRGRHRLRGRPDGDRDARRRHRRRRRTSPPTWSARPSTTRWRPRCWSRRRSSSPTRSRPSSTSRSSPPGTPTGSAPRSAGSQSGIVLVDDLEQGLAGRQRLRRRAPGDPDRGRRRLGRPGPQRRRDLRRRLRPGVAWATTAPGPTTCCRPVAARATPRASRCGRSASRCTSSSTTREGLRRGRRPRRDPGRGRGPARPRRRRARAPPRTDAVSDFPPLRDELRGLEPYGAPQLDVPVQLNVNENPYGPSAELSRPTSPPPSHAAAGTLNRYPDREFTELRSALADYLARDTRARHRPGPGLGGQRVQRGHAAAAPGLRRSGPGGAELRADVLDVPRVRPRHDDHVGPGAPRGGLLARPRPRPHPGQGAPAERRAAALARTTPPAPRCRPRRSPRSARPRPPTSRRASSSSTRPTASSAAAGPRSALELLPPAPQPGRQPDHEQGLRAGGGPGRLPGRGARRSATRSGSCACPTTSPPSPRRWRGSRCGTPPSCSAGSTSCAPSGTPPSRGCAEQGLDGRGQRRQLRALRHVRRPARRLAGSARPGRADPRGRPRRVAPGVDRHRGGDDGVQAGTDRGHGGPGMSRTARIERQTSESKVLVEVDLDGSGRHDISTGVGFYDHMLTAFARHSLVDLTVQTDGDTHIDAHHTVEDTAIVLGQALREALGDKKGIRRFGDATVPLDEALVQAVVDVSGRPYCVHTGEPDAQAYVAIGGTTGPAYQGSLTRHVFETIAFHAHLALHVRVLAGRDPHHLVETQFKAFARALRDAVALDPRETGVPSTKGSSVTHPSVVGPRLRVGQPPLRRARPRARRRRGDAHRRLRDGAERRRARRAGRGRVRRVHGRAARHRGRRGSSAAGWPAAVRCWGSAWACRCSSSAGSSTASRPRAATSGRASWSGSRRPSCRTWAGTPSTCRRGPRCSPASRRSGSTSCTPTPCATGRWRPTTAPGRPLVTWAETGSEPGRRPLRGRGGERPALRHPVPPGEVRRRRRGAAAQLGPLAVMRRPSNPGPR